MFTKDDADFALHCNWHTKLYEEKVGNTVVGAGSTSEGTGTTLKLTTHRGSVVLEMLTNGSYGRSTYPSFVVVLPWPHVIRSLVPRGK